MKHALALLPLAAAVAAVAVPAASATTGSNVLRITAATSGLRYTKTNLTARAGKIKLIFANPSALPHNVRLEQGESEKGGTKTVTHATTTAFVTLKPGKYHFYCSVPGHEDAGMQGYLTVR